MLSRSPSDPELGTPAGRTRFPRGMLGSEGSVEAPVVFPCTDPGVDRSSEPRGGDLAIGSRGPHRDSASRRVHQKCTRPLMLLPLWSPQ